jgi:NADH-ubiquinone oxidoreductase chain 5
MLILITGGNFLVMFIGWESIGVVSYLLINFYFTRIQANKAALLAFTMNRGGDMLMSIGFFAIYSICGSLCYSDIFSIVPYFNENILTLIALLLLGGALAKSANIPLHSWLPGSMEA